MSKQIAGQTGCPSLGSPPVGLSASGARNRGWLRLALFVLCAWLWPVGHGPKGLRRRRPALRRRTGSVPAGRLQARGQGVSSGLRDHQRSGAAVQHRRVVPAGLRAAAGPRSLSRLPASSRRLPIVPGRKAHPGPGRIAGASPPQEEPQQRQGSRVRPELPPSPGQTGAPSPGRLKRNPDPDAGTANQTGDAGWLGEPARSQDRSQARSQDRSQARSQTDTASPPWCCRPERNRQRCARRPGWGQRRR